MQKLEGMKIKCRNKWDGEIWTAELGNVKVLEISVDNREHTSSKHN